MKTTQTKLGLPTSSITGVNDNVPRPTLYAKALRRGDTASLASASSLMDTRTTVCHADGPRSVSPAGGVRLSDWELCLKFRTERKTTEPSKG